MTDRTFVTTIVLLLLGMFASEYKDEWSMMKRKVLKYLKKQADFTMDIYKYLEKSFLKKFDNSMET
jgi:hypothetical protein